MFVDHSLKQRSNTKVKTKQNRRLKIFIKTNQIKLYFQHDKVYGDFQNLPKITETDNLLSDKAFNIAKNPKYDEYRPKPTSKVYIRFI